MSGDRPISGWAAALETRFDNYRMRAVVRLGLRTLRCKSGGLSRRLSAADQALGR
jgi:hypothetical protein